MASSLAPRTVARQVRPVLSLNNNESRRRVLALYRAWYRQIPVLVLKIDIPKSEEQCRQKLREEFLKHKHVTDVRTIDILVIKGQMLLKECANHWQQKSHMMSFWKDTQDPKPTDFLSKFLQGSD